MGNVHTTTGPHLLPPKWTRLLARCMAAEFITSLPVEVNMKATFCGFWIVGLLLTAIAGAEDAKDEAIKKDRKLIEGTWRIVALEVNGNKSSDEDAKKLSWSTGPTECGASSPKARRSPREQTPSI